jgi:hypothetical protein
MENSTVISFINSNFIPVKGDATTSEDVVDTLTGTADNVTGWDEQSKKGFTVSLLDDGEIVNAFVTYKGAPLYFTQKASGRDGGFQTWAIVRDKKLGTQLGVKSISVSPSASTSFVSVHISTKTEKISFKFAEEEEGEDGDDEWDE